MAWDGKPSVYPADWAKIRALWAAKHQPTHLCVRCGRRLGPMGPHLHLDHDDYDRSVVRGFAHARCNLVAAAHKSNRNRRRGAVRSRRW